MTRTLQTLAPADGSAARLRALLAANPSLIAACAGVVILLALAASEGGFYPVNTSRNPGLGWYPAALLALSLLAATAIAVPPRRPLPRPIVAALALLAAFTAWSYLSILWAEQQGVAWDGANRTALYLVLFALFSLWPMEARGAQVVLGALGLGLAGLGLVELLRANGADDPALYFASARLAEPAGYINANVALWTLGMWPCLYLACAREAAAPLRGLALGGAGLLGCLALLGQSRGWALVLVPAILLFVALMPGRARALGAVALTAGGVFLAKGPLLAVHDDFTERGFDALVASATRASLTVAAVLGVVGVLAALADRRTDLSHARSRAVNRAAVAGLAVVLLLAGAGAAIAAGDPAARLSDSWESFKDGGELSRDEGSRFSAADTNRYDFWSVAWQLFRDQPLRGIGSENFQTEYVAQGSSTEQPRYPHSLQLGVLSQTGLVGALLLAVALVAAVLAALTVRRRAGAAGGAAAGAGLTLFGYWLLHASVDWFWEFPSLTGIAFAGLGLAGAVAQGPERADSANGRAATRARPAVRVLAIAGLGVTGGALALSLAAPWLAEREVNRAITSWPQSPSAAFERLDRAKSLNPLSPRPGLAAATIAVRVEDQARAATELREVLELEPRTSFALAELAALASERGEKRRSVQLFRRAAAHAPRDQVVAAALERVESGAVVDIRSLNDSYIRKVRSRTGRD